MREKAGFRFASFCSMQRMDLRSAKSLGDMD
jgi:hypothetical protein